MGGGLPLIINVLNRALEVVTWIDNDVPKLPSYYNDTLIEYLEVGTASFDFTINKKIDGVVQDYVRFFTDETSFTFTKDGKDFAFFPSGDGGFYETNDTIQYKCLSLNRELSIEYSNKLENSTAHSLEWYLKETEVILHTQITIGENQVSDKIITLNYDSQDTKINRLLSLISNFSAEFEFVTTLSDNGQIESIVLNIYKERNENGDYGVGAFRNDVQLTNGENIEGIERSTNFDFFNASTVTGKDGLSWINAEFSYKNTDGVEEFYKLKGDNTAYAPLSAQRFPSQFKDGRTDIYLRKDFETEYTTPEQMTGYILSQFKKYAYPQVTYKVNATALLATEAFENAQKIHIGDTITIHDTNFISSEGTFGLLVTARCLTKKTSDSNPEQNELTFTNFKEIRSEITSDLTSKMQELINANTPYRALITTTNGIQFVNNKSPASTSLIASIYFGNSSEETGGVSYKWFKDGVNVGNTKEITVLATDIEKTAVYSFNATLEGMQVATASVTISNVFDGADGKNGTSGSFATVEEPEATLGTMWKYTGAKEITVGGVTILPNTEYYFNGTTWELSVVSSDNIGKNSIEAPKLDIPKVSDLTNDLGSINSGEIDTKVEIDYSTGSAVTKKALAVLREDIDQTNHKIGVQSLNGDDYIYTLMNSGGLTLYADSQNVDGIGSASGRYLQATLSANGMTFVQSNTKTTNAFGDNVPAPPYTGTENFFFDGKDFVTTAPIRSVGDTTGWVDIPLNSGYSGKAKYMVLAKVVYISIAGFGTPALTGGTWGLAGTVPTEIRPATNMVTSGYGNGVWGLGVNPAGALIVQSPVSVSATSNLVNGMITYPI